MDMSYCKRIILVLILTFSVLCFVGVYRVSAQYSTTYVTCDGIGCSETKATCDTSCSPVKYPANYYVLPNNMADYWWWNTDLVGVEPPYPVCFPWEDPYSLNPWPPARDPTDGLSRSLIYLFMYLSDNVLPSNVDLPFTYMTCDYPLVPSDPTATPAF